MSSHSLRDFRKKNQTSMLRYIRHSSNTNNSSKGMEKSEKAAKVSSAEKKSENTLGNSTSPILGSKCTQDSNTNKVILVDKPSSKISFQCSSNTLGSIYINGCTASSPNKLDSTPPPPLYSSKIFYVKPEDSDTSDDSKPVVDAKESGFDISAVLKDKSLSSNLISQDSTDSPIVGGTALVNKKRRIDSDDDDSQDGPVNKKPCQENGSQKLTNGSSGSKRTKTDKYEDSTIEQLIDTYNGVYLNLDRMEIYEFLERNDFELTPACAEMEELHRSRKLSARKALVKERLEEKGKMKVLQRQVRLDERDRHKTGREDDRMQMKVKKAQEMERKKQIWKMKAQFHEDEELEDEDEYIGKSKVYVSDSSDDEEVTEDREELNPARNMVLSFFNEGTVSEIMAVPRCSKKKAEIIIAVRPFHNWTDIVTKFKTEKLITAEMLNSAKEVLQMRNSVQRLMKKCEKISNDIKNTVSQIIDGDVDDEISKQPSILNPEFKLKNYQLIGLNWLVLMHEQQLNGVLADEMGLGKTIQAIAFLAHLKEKNELEEQMSLIVVPSSTLDNWAREMEQWCPSLGFLVYHGSQEERRGMRMEIANNQLDEGVYLILTTYNMVTSSSEDKGLFKKIKFHTVIFDEAHMLKNMASQRYENLMKIRCKRRLLLTGTPLQNNLVELMSILVFVMPQLFEGRKEELKKVFSMFPKSEGSDSKGVYEKDRIIQAKRIMAPFFLRRLKVDVLKDLPLKTEEVIKVSMAERQLAVYHQTVTALKKRAHEKKEELEQLKIQEVDEVSILESAQSKGPKKSGLVNEDSSSSMLMKLRKIANHPLLARSLYTQGKIEKIAAILKRSSHQDSVLEYIIEDMIYMSDFEIHQTCDMYQQTKKFCLEDGDILGSGKFKKLDEMLPKMKEAGDRVLIFSQFVLVLNIIEQYLKIRNYSFVRLDGQTNISERQDLIDDFNEDGKIFIFLLSTRAGGLGINLTAANTVILHDIDFNPYNDKQAEDRCHRVGQTRPVNIYRYICNNSIEEGMHQIANNKLQLEKDVTGKHDDHKKTDVLFLLKTALGEA